MSTAIVTRLLADPGAEALAMLHGGTPSPPSIAAPLGSFLGGLIGWRGAFFFVVPLGFSRSSGKMALVLPRCRAARPPRRVPPSCQPHGRARHGRDPLLFMGQFALFTYLRPFLESRHRPRREALAGVPGGRPRRVRGTCCIRLLGRRA